MPSIVRVNQTMWTIRIYYEVSPLNIFGSNRSRGHCGTYGCEQDKMGVAPIYLKIIEVIKRRVNT